LFSMRMLLEVQGCFGKGKMPSRQVVTWEYYNWLTR
jgi:hypothetical protein